MDVWSAKENVANSLILLQVLHLKAATTGVKVLFKNVYFHLTRPQPHASKEKLDNVT